MSSPQQDEDAQREDELQYAGKQKQEIDDL